MKEEKRGGKLTWLGRGGRLGFCAVASDSGGGQGAHQKYRVATLWGWGWRTGGLTIINVCGRRDRLGMEGGKKVPLEMRSGGSLVLEGLREVR